MIESDRNAGYSPFLLVGTAGTVDTGAIDDLDGLAEIASEERMWLHVDGAYGALGILAPEIAPRLAGIEAADSLAFDFHKWGQVPYDAGFVLVRDGELHRKAFASPAAYLEREARGLAAGSTWPCDLGPGSFARIPGAEDLVHAEGLWAAGSRPDDRAHLRAGAISGTEGHGSGRIGAAGAGVPQHCLFPLSVPGRGPRERTHRDGSAGIGRVRAIHHPDQWRTGDSRRDHQPSNGLAPTSTHW